MVIRNREGGKAKGVSWKLHDSYLLACNTKLKPEENEVGINYKGDKIEGFGIILLAQFTSRFL